MICTSECCATVWHIFLKIHRYETGGFSLFLFCLPDMCACAISWENQNKCKRSIAYHIFFSQNFLSSTKDLSGATIVIFRRCLRSSSLLAFYKIGVLKISAKFLGKHICRSLFSIKL